MKLKEKSARLYELYGRFQEAAGPYLSQAVCKAGCADCCTTVGDVDITTLEGMIILTHLQNLPPAVQKDFAKRLKNNIRTRSESKFARCAFLSKADRCEIYEVRPFSCRRLYSVRPCGEAGPAVHRQAWEAAREGQAAGQELDDTGYSGHMSYILKLLKDATFRKTYLNGGFAPEDIRDFARAHRIIINRYATQTAG